MKGPMLCFIERFSVKGRAEKCKNEGIRVQNMSDLISDTTASAETARRHALEVQKRDLVAVQLLENRLNIVQ